MDFDPRRFADIVDRHQAMVFSIGYNFFRDRALAEDLAQEVFFDLFRHLGSIESDAHLTNWLRQAMTRRSIDQARWRKLHRRESIEAGAEPAASPMTPDPLLGAALRKRLAALPDRNRMVLVLRFQEDLELEEIAQVLEMPVNTVKSTLHRALAVLRRRLAPLVVRETYGTARR